jgi:hypothetical protein
MSSRFRNRRPKKYLVAALIQDPQAVGVLRQVQGLEQRPRLDLGGVEVDGDMGDPIERGARPVPCRGSGRIRS